MSVLVAADGRSRGRGACGWWLEGGWKMVEDGLSNDNKRGKLTDDERGRAHAEDFLV